MGRRGATSAAAEAGAPGNASDDPEVEATRFDNPLNDEIDEQKEKAVGKAKNEIDEQKERVVGKAKKKAAKAKNK